MHFWIDKRSSYGIGYNRSMSGLSYQHRRGRAKSIVTPVRQHPPPCVPSTSHHAKSHHLHHHRSRHGDEHRTSQSRVTQNVVAAVSTAENHAPISHPATLNTQYVPVIHSVYPRDELPVNLVVESNDSSRSNSVTNHWLPIYLKGGICVAMAIILVTLKLYYDNDLSGLQLLAFGLMSIVIVLFTTTVSVLRMKKNRAMMLHNQRDHNDNYTGRAIQPHNNQILMQSSDEANEPPPPYAVAVAFPDKQSVAYESPPPSYEKINII